MSGPQTEKKPVCAVGIACFRGDEVLLVKRATEPRQGEWSIPGGRIEFGETTRQAALRELAEETGVSAELAGLVDVVDAVFADQAGAPDGHYVLVDFAAIWQSGDPVAGDDAAEAKFVKLDQLAGFDLWAETTRIIIKGAEIARQHVQE